MPRTTTKHADRTPIERAPKPPRNLLIRWTGRAIFALALGAGITFVLLDNRHFRRAVFAEPYRKPLPHVEPFVLRSALLDRRDSALRRADLTTVAEIHAVLSREAALRARATFDAWMPRRYAETGLFPQSEETPEWNYRNTAADFFCFQFHVGLYTDSDQMPLLRETIKAEAALARPGELCTGHWAETGKLNLGSSENATFGSRGPLFGTSEYIKDGLLSLFEGTGDLQVRDRMLELLDVMIAHAEEESRYGTIFSTSAEINGEMLQTLPRVALLPGVNPEYEAMLARLAEAAVSQMLAGNHALPAQTYDFTADTPTSPDTHLRDHGNEIIAGMTEAYAFAVSRTDDPAWLDRADRWGEPIARMIELILEHGRSPRGLLVNRIDPETLAVTDPQISDNWGYVLNGVILFTDAAERHGGFDPARLAAMREAAREIARAVAATDRLPWEGNDHDGYADTIESALYVAHHDPATAPDLLPWVDHQIDIMFQMQSETGFTSGGYLDGNFMRTALMYADLRSGGWVVDTWDPGVSVGLAEGADGRAVLVVQCANDYAGTLTHRSLDSGFADVLPWDWARLNSWPTWVSPDRIAEVVALETPDGTPDTPPTPGQLAAGWPFSIPAGGRIVLELRLKGQVPEAR